MLSSIQSARNSVCAQLTSHPTPTPCGTTEAGQASLFSVSVSFTFTRHSYSTGEKKIPVKTEWMGKRSLHFIQNQIAFQNREAKWQRNQAAS